MGRKQTYATKSQLETLVRRMHKTGILYYEALEEFRKQFILVVLREVNGHGTKRLFQSLPSGTSQPQVWRGSEPHRGRDGQRLRGGAKATSLLNAPSKDFLDLVRQYRPDSPQERNARHCGPM